MLVETLSHGRAKSSIWHKRHVKDCVCSYGIEDMWIVLVKTISFRAWVWCVIFYETYLWQSTCLSDCLESCFWCTHETYLTFIVILYKLLNKVIKTGYMKSQNQLADLFRKLLGGSMVKIYVTSWAHLIYMLQLEGILELYYLNYYYCYKGGRYCNISLDIVFWFISLDM